MTASGSAPARRHLAAAVCLVLAAAILAGCGRKAPPAAPPGEPNTYPRSYPSH